MDARLCPLQEPDLTVKHIFMSPRRRVLRILTKTILILRSVKLKMIICIDVFLSVYKACFSVLVLFFNFENIAVREYYLKGAQQEMTLEGFRQSFNGWQHTVEFLLVFYLVGFGYLGFIFYFWRI